MLFQIFYDKIYLLLCIQLSALSGVWPYSLYSGTYMENTEEHSDVFVKPTPIERPIGGNAENADKHAEVPNYLKKLPFTLILKKERLKSEDSDYELDYTARIQSKAYNDQRPGGSRSLWDRLGANANPFAVDDNHHDPPVVESKPLISTSFPFDIKPCDFTPVQLIDVTNLRYCSFCFTSNESVAQEIEHETCSLRDFPGLPSDYWPNGWPSVHYLSYKGIDCAVSGCKSEAEDSIQLLEHLKTCHIVQALEVPRLPEIIGSSELEEIQCNDNEPPESDRDGFDFIDAMDINGRIKGADANLNQDWNEVTDNNLNSVAGSSLDMDLENSDQHLLHGSENGAKQNCRDVPGENTGDKKDGDFNLWQASNETWELIQSNVARKSTSHSILSLKPYKCGLCHLMASDVRDMKQHYFHYHDINRLYICEDCQFVSHLKLSLKKHWSRFHFPTDAPPEPIVVTEEPFDESVMMPAVPGNSKTKLGTIMPNHNLENYNEFLRKSLVSFRFSCNMCGYYTKLFDTFRCHMSKHITTISETLINLVEDTTAYRCVTCKAVKNTKGQMAYHYASEHVKTKKLECQLCDKSLRDFTQFAKHCASDRHADFYRRSLRCKKCLFATLHKAKLQKHAITHAPDFKCSKCSFTTKIKVRLKYHTDTVHGYEKDANGLYWCENEGCGFSTKVKHNLTHHRVLHRQTTKSQIIPCEKCDFVAGSSRGISMHMKIHDKKIPSGE